MPVILSAAFFSIVFLTKSHILLFTPFIALAYFLYIKPVGRGALFALCFAAISLASTLPFGIYNLHQHGEYVMSSNGLKFHFYTGNSDFGYASIVDVPPKNTLAYTRLKDFNLSYFNGEIHDSIMALPQKVKQRFYFQFSLNWIKDNPSKFIELKINNLIRFLMPGVSRRQYPATLWLLALLVSFPVYLFGYAGMIIALRKDFRVHFFILGLFFTMVMFSVVFYAQNRFRTITLEPFYIIYGAFGFLYSIEYLLRKRVKE